MAGWCSTAHHGDGVCPEATSGAETIDFEIDLSSMGDDQVVVNVADAPTAAFQMHYLILGGDAIDAARVGTYQVTAAVATQDVTVASGSGPA